MPTKKDAPVGADDAPVAIEYEPAAEAVAEVEAAPEAPSLADPASLGFAKISHPGGATSVSHGGQTYEADKNGFITVPLAAVDDLTSHGFVLA